jgi:hypothetical protein
MKADATMGRRVVAQGVQVLVDLAPILVEIWGTVDEDGGFGLEEVPGVVSVDIEIVKGPPVGTYPAPPGWRAVVGIGLARADWDCFYPHPVLEDEHQLFVLVDDDGAAPLVAEG